MWNEERDEDTNAGKEANDGPGHPRLRIERLEVKGRKRPDVPPHIDAPRYKE